MCQKMFIVRLFVISIYFAFGKAITLEIFGKGLAQDNSSFFEKIYEHKYNGPENLELTCTLKGAFGDYDLLLLNDRDYVGKRVTLLSPVNTGSISYTFKLTPKSKTILCIARDVDTDLSRFISKVLLKYEEREAAAPSTPIDASPRPDGQPDGRPAPIIQNETSSARLDTRAMSNTTMTPPPADVMSDVSTHFWTPSTSINFFVAGIALVSIGLLTCVVLHYRKRAIKNRIPDDIINRPPLDLPSEIIYEEVYSHCRAFRNRGNGTKKHVLPVHGLKNIQSHQTAVPPVNGLVPIKRINK